MLPLPLSDLRLPAGCPVAVIAPHPDDFDAIGVTLRRLREAGHPLAVTVLTSASGVEDVYCGPRSPTPELKAEIRRAEQRRSCGFFGLPPECLEFPECEQDGDWQVLESPRNAALLREFLQRTAAEIVFLPHGNDTNRGHQCCWALFRAVAAGLGRPLAGCYIRDPKTLACRLDLYAGFGQEEAEWKAELLRFHHSQQQRNLRTRGTGLDVRILETNRTLARQLGIGEEYAEAFEVELFGHEGARSRIFRGSDEPR